MSCPAFDRRLQIPCKLLAGASNVDANQSEPAASPFECLESVGTRLDRGAVEPAGKQIEAFEFAFTYRPTACVTSQLARRAQIVRGICRRGRFRHQGWAAGQEGGGGGGGRRGAGGRDVLRRGQEGDGRSGGSHARGSRCSGPRAAAGHGGAPRRGVPPPALHRCVPRGFHLAPGDFAPRHATLPVR